MKSKSVVWIGGTVEYLTQSSKISGSSGNTDKTTSISYTATEDCIAVCFSTCWSDNRRSTAISCTGTYTRIGSQIALGDGPGQFKLDVFKLSKGASITMSCTVYAYAGGFIGYKILTI